MRTIKQMIEEWREGNIFPPYLTCTPEECFLALSALDEAVTAMKWASPYNHLDPLSDWLKKWGME